MAKHSILLVLLAVLPSLGASGKGAPPPPAGLTFRFVDKSESTTPHGPSAREIRGRVAIDHGRFRVDFERGLGLIQDGCWMISTDGGKTVSFVRPPDVEKGRAKGTIAQIDVDETLKAAGEVIEGMGGVVGFKTTNPKVVVNVDPMPVKILGYKARKTTLEISYSLVTNIQGITHTTKTRSVTDYWTTDVFGDLKIPLLDGRTSLRTGQEAVDKLLEAQAKALRGLPLKMKSRTDVTDSNGKTASTDASLQLIDVKEVDVPEATYSLPDGYDTSRPLSVLALNP